MFVIFLSGFLFSSGCGQGSSETDLQRSAQWGYQDDGPQGTHQTITRLALEVFKQHLGKRDNPLTKWNPSPVLDGSSWPDRWRGAAAGV
jgi:hypothetical protein